MARVVMITGGNIGEVEGNLKRAKQMVEQRVGKIIEESKAYGSEPWGRFQPEEAGEWRECDYKVRGFLNQVLIVETKLEAIEVLDVIQQIEIELGRVREKGEGSVCEVRVEEKGISRIVEERAEEGRSKEISMRERDKETEKFYLSRTMDIDILYYDDIVMDSQRLVIPHPMIEEREFVLVPLAELMPNYKDPRTGRTVNQMLKKFIEVIK